MSFSSLTRLGGAAAITAAIGAGASSQSRLMAGRQVMHESTRLPYGALGVGERLMVRAAEASQKPLLTVGEAFATCRQNLTAKLGNVSPLTSSPPSPEGSTLVSFGQRAVQIDSNPLSKAVNVVKNLDFIFHKLFCVATLVGTAITNYNQNDEQATLVELKRAHSHLENEHFQVKEQHLEAKEKNFDLKKENSDLKKEIEELKLRCEGLEARITKLPEENPKPASPWRLF